MRDKENRITGKRCIGIDIGGTSVKIGLFKIDGTLVDKQEVKTRKGGQGKYILEGVAASIRERLADKRIGLSETAEAGIGVPGPTMPDGYMKVCVNLDWRDKSPVKGLYALLDVPVRAGNDANVVALGGMWQGGGKEYTGIVMVTLGTDVGDGATIDEKIIAGKHGLGGEISHIHTHDEETEHCSCGGVGYVEQVALAAGIAREARRKMAASGKPSAPREFGEHMTAKNVLDAAKAGDELAVDMMGVIGHYPGPAPSQLALTVNPEIFTIGGGVSKAGQSLIDMIDRYYDKHMVTFKNRPIIGLAMLGNDAGIYGAVRLIPD